MNCPKDQTALRERERETGGELVLMDVCPTCGGIWLDKGELEKLAQSETRYYAQGQRREDDDDDDDRGRERSGHGESSGQGDRSGGHGGRGSQQQRRRGGFLGNIFEGFGD